MEREPRKLGLDVIGEAPWGTHLCQFYATNENLADILVPYIKAGLENNDCWQPAQTRHFGTREIRGVEELG